MSSQRVIKENWMHPIRWVSDVDASLLDVGCNTGELLEYCRRLYPTISLAGVEVNPQALSKAQQNLPDADLHLTGADNLPFPDERFDCVTCIEVLEHIPAKQRARALQEMRRVLREGGRLILRVPHSGMFAFLDSNNFRFRLPLLYRLLLGRGRRDAGFVGGSKDVVWHHHFTREEILTLASVGWKIEAVRTGGLLLFPLGDIAAWPFYRFGNTNNRFYRAINRIMDFDLGCDYGAASFDMLIVLRRTE